jgi:hypothetical protein
MSIGLAPIPEWAVAIAYEKSGLDPEEHASPFGVKSRLYMSRHHFVHLVTQAERSEEPEEYLRGALNGWNCGYDARPVQMSEAYWEGVREGAQYYHYNEEWEENRLPPWSKPPLITHSYSEDDYGHLPDGLRMPRCCRQHQGTVHGE